jgi:class 3 adenylate cyclase/tetratricopeptide (TPR) repeat protein
VICPACERENRPDSRFCLGCGVPLARSCAACGRELPPNAAFCDGCGQPLASESKTPSPASGEPPRDLRVYTPKHLSDKILTSRSALEGELKQVTVLFTDIKGSVQLSEHVDPEHWHRILDRFFRILADGVHRFEGTVNQFTGDGAMALFGAPIAHEDHAQRACWAALHLKKALRRYGDELRMGDGLNFSVRMGVNSGDVVVGRIGDDLRMDYTAQGHTVGLAARMEQLAEAGRIYLTEHTAALVGGYFTLEELGEVRVRGAEEPLRAFALEGVGPLRTRLDVSRARGFSRFVGRVDEMATLEATLQRTSAGQGQVVGVVADAGVGKSRLCWEFGERCRNRGIAFHSGHGVAHGRMLPFLPIRELLRSLLDVDEHDAPQAARNKIAGFLLLLDRSFSESLPSLFEFLGVGDAEHPAPPLNADARQQQLQDLVRRLLRALGERQPQVLMLEDLHWIDGGSEAFLESMVEAVDETPTLLLVNFRPGFHAEWMRQSAYQQLPLLPLAPEQSRELLGELLGADPSLADVAGRIDERAGGNPFFMEEVVRSLVESGHLSGVRGDHRLARPLGELAIPATVRAVLAARIDRLGDRAKRTLQTAAVIGRSFSEGLLSQVAEADGEALAGAVHALIANEFIYESVLYPETEYRFRHALTREVALNSQLASQRARLHAAVARAVEERDADRLDERAALLAHHYESAGDRLQGARWHRRAAEWAGASHAAESFGHWVKVRDLMSGLSVSDASADELGAIARAQILAYGARVGAPEDEMRALYEEGRELAERSASDAAMARIQSGYGIYRYYTTGERDDALSRIRESVSLADASGDAELRTVCRFYLQLALSAHDVAAALDVNEEGFTLCGDDAAVGAALLGYSPRIGFLATRPALLCRAGRMSECGAAIGEALAHARTYGDPLIESLAHGQACAVAWTRGDASRAVASGQHAVEVSERVGNDALRILSYHQLGRAQVLAEQWQDAERTFDHGLELIIEHRTYAQYRSSFLSGLACARLGQGRIAAADEASRAAVETASLTGDFVEAEARLVRAHVRSCLGASAEEVETLLDSAAALFERAGALGRAPWLSEARALVARLQGDAPRHSEWLRKASQRFRSDGASAQAERVARWSQFRINLQIGLEGPAPTDES